MLPQPAQGHLLLDHDGPVEAAHLQPARADVVDEAREAREAGEIKSAREIQRLMRERYPDAFDIYIADLIRDRRPVYVIRVLPARDRRLDVFVDARTGLELPEDEAERYRNYRRRF